MQFLHHIGVWFFDIQGYIMYSFGFLLSTIIGLVFTNSKKRFLTTSAVACIFVVLVLNYFYCYNNK